MFLDFGYGGLPRKQSGSGAYRFYKFLKIIRQEERALLLLVDDRSLASGVSPFVN